MQLLLAVYSILNCRDRDRQTPFASFSDNLNLKLSALSEVELEEQVWGVFKEVHDMITSAFILRHRNSKQIMLCWQTLITGFYSGTERPQNATWSLSVSVPGVAACVMCLECLLLFWSSFLDYFGHCLPTIICLYILCFHNKTRKVIVPCLVFLSLGTNLPVSAFGSRYRMF